MGLVDKFKGMFVSLDEEYDNEVDFIQSNNTPQGAETAQQYAYEEDKPSASTRKSGNKVVNINATTQLKVILVKPEQFEDASSIADHLNAKRTVVLNLESATRELSRRLIDFLSGVAYANNGQISRVANSTYIITPYNVDFMGNLLDELENNGVYI